MVLVVGKRVDRVMRAVRAYYNWDDIPTNPIIPLGDPGRDIDADAMWTPTDAHCDGVTCGHVMCGRERGRHLPTFEQWQKHTSPVAPVPIPDGINTFNPERGWMGTFHGGKFFPLAPKAADVNIVDIAHGLAMTCRYGGQCKRYYSVAEHCVHVSHMVDPKYALHGLLHDSAEAWMGDMPRPLKHQPEMKAFRDAEAAVEIVVAQALGLKWTPEIHAAVKEIDNRILVDEVLQLQPVPELYTDVLQQQPLGVPLQCWVPDDAEARFMARYYELTLAARTRTVQP